MLALFSEKKPSLLRYATTLAIVVSLLALFVRFFQVLPSHANPNTPINIVFVHGMPDLLHGQIGVDCDDTWKVMETFIQTQWGVDYSTASSYFHPVQYYSADTVCSNQNKYYKPFYSLDLHTQPYQDHCTNYPGDGPHFGEGTIQESIFHLSCLFAWYLYYNFGQSDQKTVLIGYSMGGLIMRATLYQVQNRASLGTGNIFPSTIGQVTDAITVNTPHSGVLAALGFCCQEMDEMTNESAFMQELILKGEAPETPNGTYWTLIASACDHDVQAANATSMLANHIVIYNTASNNNTCYDHGKILTDTSTDLNSSQAACYVWDYKDLSPDSCTNSNTTQISHGAHSLQEIYKAVSGIESLGGAPVR